MSDNYGQNSAQSGDLLSSGLSASRAVNTRESLVHMLMSQGARTVEMAITDAKKLFAFIHDEPEPVAGTLVPLNTADVPIKHEFDNEGRIISPLPLSATAVQDQGAFGDVVTKHYADGTSATGSPQLPDTSPDGTPVVKVTSGPPLSDAPPAPPAEPNPVLVAPAVAEDPALPPVAAAPEPEPPADAPLAPPAP